MQYTIQIAKTSDKCEDLYKSHETNGWKYGCTNSGTSPNLLNGSKFKFTQGNSRTVCSNWICESDNLI